MEQENNIYLPNVETSALIWQAMSLGTRMELLDLLDYAKKNNTDYISVAHLQEEIKGLTKLDEEEFNSRAKCYMRTDQRNPYVPCKEELPKEGKPVLVYRRSEDAGDSCFVAMLTRNWMTKDKLDDNEPEESFIRESGMKVYIIEGNAYAMDENGDYYEINENGKPYMYWVDHYRDSSAVYDIVDRDSDYWLNIPIMPTSSSTE